MFSRVVNKLMSDVLIRFEILRTNGFIIIKNGIWLIVHIFLGFFSANDAKMQPMFLEK